MLNLFSILNSKTIKKKKEDKGKDENGTYLKKNILSRLQHRFSKHMEYYIPWNTIILTITVLLCNLADIWQFILTPSRSSIWLKGYPCSVSITVYYRNAWAFLIYCVRPEFLYVFYVRPNNEWLGIRKNDFQSIMLSCDVLFEVKNTCLAYFNHFNIDMFDCVDDSVHNAAVLQS